MTSTWQRILGNSVLGAMIGGVVGGVVLENNKTSSMDVRRSDHGEGLFARAQENERLLQMVVDLSILKKHSKSENDFNAMHRKMGRLLHLEENLFTMPKRASWTEVARLYSLDVREHCRSLVKHIVREMKQDKEAYPNAVNMVDSLKEMCQAARDSAQNIEKNNLQIFHP